MRYLILALLLSGCASLKKDNKPSDPTSEVHAHLRETQAIYMLEGVGHVDEYGLLSEGSLKGDSALFSCLGRAAGMLDFDVRILFIENGDGLRPVRHPEISPENASAPISKDMVEGILWCLYDLGKENREGALEIVKAMIEYGRANRYISTWNFCTEEDKKTYDISEEDFLGKCVMTPAKVKDVYRVAIWLGWECDSQCKITMAAGSNLPVEGKGSERHLAVLTTVRNGLVDGAINDNSKNLLKHASEQEPGNALYAAAYGLFNGGKQEAAFELLCNHGLFPPDRLPTDANYCTDYLFRRDERRVESVPVVGGCIDYHHPQTKELVQECGFGGDYVTSRVYNKDWLPCLDGHPKTGVDWLFAAAMALGDL